MQALASKAKARSKARRWPEVEQKKAKRK